MGRTDGGYDGLRFHPSKIQLLIFRELFFQVDPPFFGSIPSFILSVSVCTAVLPEGRLSGYGRGEVLWYRLGGGGRIGVKNLIYG
jgi:hypothetical protein